MNPLLPLSFDDVDGLLSLNGFCRVPCLTVCVCLFVFFLVCLLKSKLLHLICVSSCSCDAVVGTKSADECMEKYNSQFEKVEAAGDELEDRQADQDSKADENALTAISGQRQQISIFIALKRLYFDS